MGFAIAMRSNDLEILPIEATDSTAETLADDSLGQSSVVAGNSGNNLVVRRDIVEKNNSNSQLCFSSKCVKTRSKFNNQNGTINLEVIGIFFVSSNNEF